MPIYNYTAINQSGRKVRGSTTAVNHLELEKKLQELDLDLLKHKQQKEMTSFLNKSLTIKDKITILIHLEQLENAGVPILDSLSDLRDSSDNLVIKNLMSSLYDSIKNGMLLSEAMAEHPKVFNNVFLGLVNAGEKTGNMGEVFGHLSHHLKWTAAIRSKIKKATVYPTFLLLIMFAVISLMMVFVIPQLSEFLTQQNFELPKYTYALIATSEFFETHWWVILFLPIAIVITVKVGCRLSYSFAYIVDHFKLSIPFIGPVINKIELSRFCHFFSITFSSGIGILECIEISANVVDNRVIKENLFAIMKQVSNGSTMTNAMRTSHQFPSIIIRMFKIGEETGNLTKSLENVNYFFDKEVEDTISSMVGAIQPALTIIMGGLMFWVTLAVFGPLYSSFSDMKF